MSLETCAICLEEMDHGDPEVASLVLCDHRFHESCLRKWIIVGSKCPLCREVIFVDNRDSLKQLAQEIKSLKSDLTIMVAYAQMMRMELEVLRMHIDDIRSNDT